MSSVASSGSEAHRAEPSLLGTAFITIYCEDESEDEGDDYEEGDEYQEGDEGSSKKERGNGGEGQVEMRELAGEKVKPPIDQDGTSREQNERRNTAPEEKEKRTVLVHKSFACHRSPYFDRAFNNPSFIEASTNRIVIQADPVIMASLVEWIYKGALDELYTFLPLRQLIRLWILADRLLMPHLQNQAMKLYLGMVHWHAQHEHAGETHAEDAKMTTIDAKLLRYVWNHTLDKSPLRSALLRTWFIVGNKEELKRNKHLLPRQMLLDFALSFMEERGFGNLLDGDLASLAREDFFVDETPMTRRRV